VQTLHLAPLILETLRIIDCHRDVARQSLQDFDLCAGKGINIVVRCPEDPMIRSRTVKGMMTSERV